MIVQLRLRRRHSAPITQISHRPTAPKPLVHDGILHRGKTRKWRGPKSTYQFRIRATVYALAVEHMDVSAHDPNSAFVAVSVFSVSPSDDVLIVLLNPRPPDAAAAAAR